MTVPRGTSQQGPMMCRELVELVTDYVEGRMPADDVARFEAHLELCEPCVTYVEQIRQTIALVGSATEDDLPAGAADVLLAEFRDWKAARS